MITKSGNEEPNEEHILVGSSTQPDLGDTRYVCARCQGPAYLSASWVKRTREFTKWKAICTDCFDKIENQDVEIEPPSIARIMRDLGVSRDHAHILRARLFRQLKENGNRITVRNEKEETE